MSWQTQVHRLRSYLKENKHLNTHRLYEDHSAAVEFWTCDTWDDVTASIGTGTSRSLTCRQTFKNAAGTEVTGQVTGTRRVRITAPSSLTLTLSAGTIVAGKGDGDASSDLYVDSTAAGLITFAIAGASGAAGYIRPYTQGDGPSGKVGPLPYADAIATKHVTIT